VVGLFCIPEASIAFMDLATWTYLNREIKYRPKNSQFTTKVVSIAGDEDEETYIEDEEESYDFSSLDENYDIIIYYDINRDEDRKFVSTSLKNEFQNSRSMLRSQEWDECYRRIGHFIVYGHELMKLFLAK
jgi:hypothetical protein